MRYLWPVLIVLFVLFSIDFATQNPEVVVVKYSLDWLNYGCLLYTSDAADE